MERPVQDLTPQGINQPNSCPGCLLCVGIRRRVAVEKKRAALAKVLVVEDDRDSAEILRTLLDLCGYQVMVAHTSAQGIETARLLEPHIVLCDRPSRRQRLRRG
jgi:hypothetical protein